MERMKVRVRDGKLIGIVEKGAYGGRYIAFRGIPYAKPPIGELRFKDPAPPEPWSDSRDASKYGNVAVQINVKNEIIGDEDCLYLNVFTTDIKPLEKRPVMIWIHGGGFQSGSGDSSHHGPDYIVEKDIVLVTLNYRLGVLGFLNLYNKVATGNQGIKDVILALQWVQKNVSEFGGDSENVTIFGGSAGGAIVHYLTLSPLSEGLFHKAISQSGTATCPWALTEPEPCSTNKGFLLAKKLGKVTEDPEVAYEFLKTIDAKKLIQTQQKFLATEAERRQFLLTFTPTLDHESSNPVFPEDLTTLIHRGVKVPYLLGFTSFEGTFFLRSTNKEALCQIDSDFNLAIYPRVLATLPKIPITLYQLRSLYFGDKNVSEETISNYFNLVGDIFFLRGIIQAADIQMNNDNSGKTYLYQFSYESKTSFRKEILNVDFPGVSHGEELGYLFYYDIIKELGLSVPAPDSEDYKMINRLTQMWTDFAKTGNPTLAITDLTPIKWTPLKHAGNVYDYLDIDIEPRMKSFRKGEQRWEWENMKQTIYDQVTIRRRRIGLILNNRQRSAGGYTLFAPQTAQGKVYLINSEGELIHQWQLPVRPGRDAVILPNGNLGYNGSHPTSAKLYPAWEIWHGGDFYEVTPQGEIVWHYEDIYHHHDAQWLSNGNLLYTAAEPLSKDIATRIPGGGKDAPNGIMQGDVVREVDRTGEIVWEWRSWHHLKPECFPIHIIFDRYHWPMINGLSLTSDGLVLLSLRVTSGVVAVNRINGEIVWHVSHDILAQQHTPVQVSQDTILVFDNGNLRSGVSSPYSRALEFNPQSGKITWQYSDPMPSAFFSPYMGSAQRLTNGNTFICEAAFGRLFEVTAEGEIVWEYVIPFFAEYPDSFKEIISGYHNSAFRAHRYPLEAIPWLRTLDRT